MERLELIGAPETQQMAETLARLFLQAGFSYGLDADIVLGQQDLAGHLVAQGVAGDPAAAIRQVEQAVAQNPHLFSRRETPAEVEYVARKRRLVEPTKAAPAKPAPAKAAPAAPSAPASPSLSDAPVTQQYQLAVLLAVYKLGGSGKASEVTEMIPELMTLPDEHKGTYTRGADGKSEQPKYVKFVQSARGFLVQNEELESPSRGVWAITPAGVERLLQAGLI